MKRRERAVVNQTNSGTVSNAMLSELPSGGWSAYGLFRAHRNPRPLLSAPCLSHQRPRFAELCNLWFHWGGLSVHSHSDVIKTRDPTLTLPPRKKEKAYNNTVKTLQLVRNKLPGRGTRFIAAGFPLVEKATRKIGHKKKKSFNLIRPNNDSTKKYT